MNAESKDAESKDAAGEGWASRFVRAVDGLALHVRVYGAAPDRAWPVVCLPGLARTAQDFDSLARLLSSNRERPRRVLALDYRGRGLSARDEDWRNYDIQVETADVLAVLAALDVGEAVFVGTSRGGLITMALAAARPALLKAVVLNDIGPVIDGKGLIRIRGYVGKLPAPKSWDEAIDVLQRLQGAQFPGLDREGWMTLARGTWIEREDGALQLAYDSALTKTLEQLDLERSPPPLWPLYEGLSHVPVLAVRGEHSDILSAATLDEMIVRHPSTRSLNVEGQGHAPLLEGDVARRIADFIAEAEADAARSPSDPPAADAAAEPRLPRIG